jgi:3-methyladenine DNA glycosylase AlkD
VQVSCGNVLDQEGQTLYANFMQVDDILSELRGMGSPSVKKMLINNHDVREPCFGVKIGDMKTIVKRVKTDHQLALDLYATGNYDAMYLAGLVADDDRMTKRDLQRWVSQAQGGALATSTVPCVAAQGRFGWDMATKWIDTSKDHVVSAGWATFSCLVALRDDADLDIVVLKQLIDRVQKSIHTAPDAVRYAMNNFVISVGCYVKPLTKHALTVAEKIGVVTADQGDNACKIPFAPDYIRKVEKRGTLGKKRKTVKC